MIDNGDDAKDALDRMAADRDSATTHWVLAVQKHFS
jgi:hypothetical protein